jgi:hypothetical protein
MICVCSLSEYIAVEQRRERTVVSSSLHRHRKEFNKPKLEDMWVAVQRNKTSKYVGNNSTNSNSRHVGKITTKQLFKICGEEFNRATFQYLSVTVQQNP